ncbi:MAG: MFS transporter [Actinomycetota bacterium]|nr:MFS transporter [Actinomycetota bacterium]
MGKAGSNHKTVIFVGLMLGMLVAAVSQTIVSPAMPVIVAELGGIEHYSWIATSTLLVSAVTIPIVGKLSDMYGRRGFYIGGLVIFMAGSILAGAAQGFWWLVAARAIQGLGMGTIMPLSQTIIGDIISPRERGKYMGYLGGVFGVASIAGPLAGGWITDNFSWRWLFFINLPIGVAALLFIVAFFHLPHIPRRHSLDYVGFVTLGLGLSAVLLATSWGGTQYPWGSWQIISLYIVGVTILTGFVINENYVREPVLPLKLWKNSIFTLSNISNMAVAMTMFGAIFFIPIYAQGVIGVSVTNSGAVLIPLTTSMILVSILVGRLITRTGRYKGFLLAGTIMMGLGYYLLTRLEYGSTQTDLTIAMVVTGLGLGGVLQTYTLVVQNAISRTDLGVATSITQLSRSLGATLGTAIFGTIMASRMKSEIPKYLPSEALNGSQAEQFSGGSGVGAVLDPTALAQLPPAIAIGIREGLAAAMHTLFVAGLPILAVAFLATLFIKELPLRNVAFADEDAGKEMLRSANQSVPEGVHTSISAPNGRADDPLPQRSLNPHIQSANGNAGEGSTEHAAAAPNLPPPSKDYQASLQRYPELRLYAADSEHVLRMTNSLDNMPLMKRRAIQREIALTGAAKTRNDPRAVREWEQNIVDLERYVRPVDLPPGRERWVLSGMLTAEEMHLPLGELIDKNRVRSNLLDLVRGLVRQPKCQSPLN